MADFVRRVLRAAPTPRGLFLHIDITNGLVPPDWPETDLDEIYALLDAGNPAWADSTGDATRPGTRSGTSGTCPPIRSSKERS
jgi:hypothetical protein